MKTACCALAVFLMTLAQIQASESDSFELSPSGFIRHWLVAGPKETPYSGPTGSDQVLRRDALDYAQATPPVSGTMGTVGPFDLPWLFHDPGRNEFVEFSTFYKELTVVEYYAVTELSVSEGGERTVRFWAAGAADLWLNGEHLARLNVTRYRNPDSQAVTLPLKKGLNRLCVRLQCLGVRDTRILFGLQLDKASGVSVPMARAGQLVRASYWIDSVRGEKGRELKSDIPAPFEGRVVFGDGTSMAWPKGVSSAALANKPVAVTVQVDLEGGRLERQFEFPGNRSKIQSSPSYPSRREAHLRYIAKAGVGTETAAAWNAGILPLMARRLLKEKSDQDAAAFADAIAMVDARRDCADFVLAGLLRMEILGLSTPEESAEIRRAALAFRYWIDEPGNDAMCFHSENHSLLFHGCQLLAGRLYPEEIFSNSGKKGTEQAALALPRIEKWLEHVEARGFDEFNSSTYMPITVAAMLNVVDFSGDEKLGARMAAQIDRIFSDLAVQDFADGVITPQGRVYRDVLFPEDSGTQALLAYASSAAKVDLAGPRPRDRGRSGDWVVFPASSPKYQPPGDLDEKISGTVSKTYRHADVQIVVEKTPDYILTSLAVPATPRAGEHPDNDLRPGGAGYQQHLWQATLGRDCHVFVNHPGGFFDGTKSRPGYWYGNGLLPRVRQGKNWLQAIYVISDGTKTEPVITPDVWEWGSASTVRPFDLHPIPFTHAHWPSDAFDREVRSGQWVFGQKGKGLVGLWCSESLVPHDDILSGRELRANSYASAWLVVCGDLDEEKSLEAFTHRCAELKPVFDREHLTLDMEGVDTTRWWERSEPMPTGISKTVQK